MKKLITARRVSQALCLLFFIYILWSTTYPLSGRFPPETFFLINPLVMLATSLSGRIILTGAAFCLVMLALTLVFGRFFCGWVCPLGTTFDLSHWVFRRGGTRRSSERFNRGASRVKFLILALIFVCALFGIQLAWPLDPMVIMARFVSLNLIPTVTLVFDKTFVWLIRSFGLYGGVYDAYRWLKGSLLGVSIHYFSHSLLIFAFFALLCSSVFIRPRFWCRSVCPLGAVYALAARFSLLKRVVQPCKNCLLCKSRCRMGAINADLTYRAGECILCMDCIYDCPENKTAFAFKAPVLEEIPQSPARSQRGISRAQFLFLLSSLAAVSSGFRFRRGQAGAGPGGGVLRPPGVRKEADFLNRCVRCGNCMKVCITNGLQPVLLQSGPEGLWTPQLVPEIGYCEYQCTLCGNVCPTGAIKKLSVERKRLARIGLARIDRSLCLPWAKNKDCIVCEEHCPIAEKAIKLKEERTATGIILKPYIDEYLCVGCGICQNKCPVRPERAVKVMPLEKR